MKHFILIPLMFLFCLSAEAQFRMISNGTPTWTANNDSTHTATVNLQTDLTGNSFLATQITDTMFVFTGLQQLYRIETVNSTTFSSANITIVEVSNEYTTTTTAPSGQVMIFGFTAKGEIPQVPFGSTGATAQMQAAVDSYNAKVRDGGSQGGGAAEPNFYYFEDIIAGADYSLPLDTLLKYDFITVSLRFTSGDDNLVTLPDLPLTGTEHNGKTIIVHFSGQETTPGRGIVSAAGSSVIRSTFCYSDGTSVQPDTIDLASGDDVYLLYRTNQKDDYFRQCERGIFVGSEYIAPGETLPESGLTYESITTAGATLDVVYQNGSVTFTNPAAGNYSITPGGGADIIAASVKGDDGTLNASQEMVLQIDNSTNGAQRRYTVQLYDDNNNAVVDQQATGTAHTQSVSTNTTTITVPGLNGFGSTGYIIEIR